MNTTVWIAISLIVWIPVFYYLGCLLALWLTNPKRSFNG